MTIYQCQVCFEAWPLKSRQNVPSNYVCSRCSRDKKNPKKFSKENMMVPTAVPMELQNLTQIEEMLIARALPIMSVFIKPGGQRAYSGHCINFPQDIRQLASTLPHYPKDLSIIVVRMKGKENTFKDVRVRKQKVQDALVWLIKNNPQYKQVVINQQSLNSLPDDGIPDSINSVLSDFQESSDTCQPDLGPVDTEDDNVFDEHSQMTSFLPVPQNIGREAEKITNDLQSHSIDWPSVANEPYSEFTTPHLATMAFPTLFPTCVADPTNPSTYRDVPFAQKVKHLLKYGKKLMEFGITDLQVILDFHTGALT